MAVTSGEMASLQGARRRLEQASDESEDCRFTTAAGADDAYDASPWNGHIDSVKDL
jgi:hypothetical protein